MSSIRSEEDTHRIRDHFASIVDLIETLVAVSEGAMEASTSFQHALRSQINGSYQSLEASRIKFENVARQLQQQEGEPSVQDLIQSLPPLVFPVAREARDLVTRVEAVTHTQEEDFR